MNPENEETYNPADDDNQGVAQLMAQGEQKAGTEQAPQMGMMANAGQEPGDKQPVNASDSGANGVNDEMLAEEDVESGEVAD